MMKDRIYRSILRRETHSARVLPVVILLIVVVAALLWLSIEVVLRLLGLSPLLSDPRETLEALIAVPGRPAAPTIAVAAVIAILGVWMIIAGLSAGRRHRHLQLDDAPAVIDDGVIVAALAERVARAGHVSRDQVRVSVGRREAHVVITPISGVPLAAPEVREAVTQELDALRLEPNIRVALRINRQGAVGS